MSNKYAKVMAKNSGKYKSNNAFRQAGKKVAKWGKNGISQHFPFFYRLACCHVRVAHTIACIPMIQAARKRLHLNPKPRVRMQVI